MCSRLLGDKIIEKVRDGYNIGRHGKAGPQPEFYLPEYWSNCGIGRKDVFGLFPFDEKAVGNKISIKIVFVMAFRVKSLGLVCLWLHCWRQVNIRIKLAY